MNRIEMTAPACFFIAHDGNGNVCHYGRHDCLSETESGQTYMETYTDIESFRSRLIELNALPSDFDLRFVSRHE